MNRYIHLYPDPENLSHQRLRLSAGLKDLHYEAGFADFITPFEVEVADIQDKLVSDSWQELSVRPPLSAEQIEKFGPAIVNFAYSRDRLGTQEVGFIDHTGDQETTYYRTARNRKNRAA